MKRKIYEILGCCLMLFLTGCATTNVIEPEDMTNALRAVRYFLHTAPVIPADTQYEQLTDDRWTQC